MTILLNPCSVLCIGDVMIDSFVCGNVERISPESTAPVLNIQESFTILGGAGNAARNLADLNNHVEFISVIGKDENGEYLKNLLQPYSSINAHIICEEQRKTTLKTRFIARGQQLLRTDLEKIDPILETTAQNIFRIVEDKLPKVDIVVLSDYAKGVLEPKLVQSIIKISKKHKKPILIDPKGKNYSIYQGATFLCPNLKELQDVTNYSINNQEDVVRAAQELIQNYQIEHILVTQGSNGMTLVSQNNTMHIPTQAKEVYDVSGAGDTFVAVFANALASKNTIETCCKLANTASGIVVGKIGTSTVDKYELLNTYEFSYKHNIEKIYNLPELIKHIKKWRKLGYKVGFTNGCFDLLHQGHLHILNSASQKCNKLIVAVNSDRSVKNLKGQNRPIQDEITRSEILAYLCMVDAVILFNDDTPLNLIKNILPDILIKGADYTHSTVIGADIVKKHGGDIHLVDLKPNQSTTEIIKRMNEVGEKYY